MSSQEKGLSRRGFLQLSAAGAGMTLLAACTPAASPTSAPPEPTKAPAVGPTSVPAEPTVAPAPKEPVTIKHLTRGGEYISMLVDEQFKVFSETHPNIKLQVDAVVGYSHHEQLLMTVAAGTPPDSYFDANRTTGLLWKKGVNVDLEPFLAKDAAFKEDDFTDNAWMTCIYEGKRYGLPWDSGCIAWAFNIDLFEQAGLPLPDSTKTMKWDEMVDFATKLTLDMNGKHPGEPGFDPNRIKQYGVTADTAQGLFTHLFSNGAEIIEADLSSPIDTPEAIEVMQAWADLGTKKFVMPCSAYQQATTMDIRSKNIAMQIHNPSGIGRINESGIKWGAMPVPMRKVQVTSGLYSPYSITALGKHKEEAYQWIWWCCCSKEGQQMLVDFGQQQPTRKDLVEGFLSTKTPPERKYRQVYHDAFDPKTFRYPGDKVKTYWGGYYQLWLEMSGPILDPVWAGKKQYVEVAKELREKTERLLKTGEIV